MLKELWRLNKETEYSCQGDSTCPISLSDTKDSAYILFRDTYDAIWFEKVLKTLDIVYKVWIREEGYGGGRAIHFHPKDIELVTRGLQCLPS